MIVSRKSSVCLFRLLPPLRPPVREGNEVPPTDGAMCGQEIAAHATAVRTRPLRDVQDGGGQVRVVIGVEQEHDGLPPVKDSGRFV
jgi:hypothetical protein